MELDKADLRVEAVKASLQKMVRRGYIDICVIDSALKLLGIIPIGSSHAILRQLHCVDFVDMSPDLRAQIPQLLRDVFQGMDVSFESRKEEPPPEAAPAPRGFFSRLLGT